MHRNKRTNHIKNRGSRFLCSSVFCFYIGYIMPLQLCIPLCSSDNRYLNHSAHSVHISELRLSAQLIGGRLPQKCRCDLKRQASSSGKGTGLLFPPVSDGAETASAAGPQHSLCHRIYIAVTDGRLSNTHEHDFGREKTQSAKSSAKIFINFSSKIK